MSDLYSNWPVNDYRLYLAHHGVKGQKWGVRNAEWYPLEAWRKHHGNGRRSSSVESADREPRRRQGRLSNASPGQRRPGLAESLLGKETADKIRSSSRKIREANKNFDPRLAKASVLDSGFGQSIANKAKELRDKHAEKVEAKKKERFEKERIEVSNRLAAEYNKYYGQYLKTHNVSEVLDADPKYRKKEKELTDLFEGVLGHLEDDGETIEEAYAKKMEAAADRLNEYGASILRREFKDFRSMQDYVNERHRGDVERYGLRYNASNELILDDEKEKKRR